MNKIEFVAFLEQSGIDGSFFGDSRPLLTDRLAQAWKWTQIFGRVLDQAFIGELDGRPISEREGLVLRQLAGLHAKYRSSVSRLAPIDVLKKIGEDRVSAIARDQMPVTASMAAILKEAHQLIGSDNLSVLPFLNSNAIDLNQKDRDGLTPCAVAAQSGSDKCVFALCKSLANPHIPDSMGNTPLHWACAMVKPKAASVLLYHGSNPNAVNDSGVTPLMLALSKGNVDMAQKLFEYGADIRMKDRKGNTVLHRAVLAKNLASVKFLIDCGSRMDEPNTDGFTPMGLAMKDQEMNRLFLAERVSAAAAHSAYASLV